jgi:hypothetical protein
VWNMHSHCCKYRLFVQHAGLRATRGCRGHHAGGLTEIITAIAKFQSPKALLVWLYNLAKNLCHIYRGDCCRNQETECLRRSRSDPRNSRKVEKYPFWKFLATNSSARILNGAIYPFRDFHSGRLPENKRNARTHEPLRDPITGPAQKECKALPHALLGEFMVTACAKL